MTSGRAALCIGINYIGQSNALGGCVRDAQNVAALLRDHLGFTPQEITMMTDETPQLKPTRANILRKLLYMAIASQRGVIQNIFVSYSGHGSTLQDDASDEADQRDETIVPLDYSTAGHITDDELAAVFARFSPRCQIVFISDSCHSGTILDLKYRYVGGTKMAVENPNSKQTARILSLSGCMDNEYSMEAVAESGGGTVGAFSALMMKTLREHDYQITVFGLLKALNAVLGPTGQHPVACSSEPLDASTVFFARKVSAPFLVHN
jgi:hypothetical protein